MEFVISSQFLNAINIKIIILVTTIKIEILLKIIVLNNYITIIIKQLIK